MNSGTAMVCCSLIAVVFLVSNPAAAQNPKEGLWVHPRCQPLATDTMGPFVRLGDNRILTVDASHALLSPA